MSEPAQPGSKTKFAFWFITTETRLFDFIRSLTCVSSIRMAGENRGLVDIKDEYDADEAWHYIRTEVEDESQMVELDPIWEKALWL